MDMKVLFFSDKSPSMETLPSFTIGTLQEAEPNEDES